MVILTWHNRLAVRRRIQGYYKRNRHFQR